MPEYGREVQKMVDHAISLPTKEERLRCARAIIRLMESKNPQPRSTVDYEHMLWDHLYIISRRQLDIDWPYDVSTAEQIHNRPQPMARPVEGHHPRHYGRLLEETFERLKQMPAGAERDALVNYTANQMKRNLMAWGHGAAGDETVAADLERFTDGAIHLDLSKFKFERFVPTVNGGATGKKRKRIRSIDH